MPVPLRSYANLAGPRGVPLLGNALQMDPPRMQLQIEQWSPEFGPLFKLSMPDCCSSSSHPCDAAATATWPKHLLKRGYLMAV